MGKTQPLYSEIRCYVSLILMETEMMSRESNGRKTPRQIRRMQEDGEKSLAVVLEIAPRPTSAHSKDLLETLQGLPKTLKYLSWFTIKGQRESLVVHSYLTERDRAELIQQYNADRKLDPNNGAKLEDTTDVQIVAHILKRGEIRRLTRE